LMLQAFDDRQEVSVQNFPFQLEYVNGNTRSN
jgi:hypothetical protein